MQHAIIIWLAAFTSATVLAVPLDTVQDAQNECCTGFSLGEDPVCPEDEDFPKDGICWGNQHPRRVPRPAGRDPAVLGQKWVQMVNAFADKREITPEAKQGLLDIIPSCHLDNGSFHPAFGGGNANAGVRCTVDSEEQRPTPSGDDHRSDTTVLGQNWLQIFHKVEAGSKQKWVDSISRCQINLYAFIPNRILELDDIKEVWCQYA
ncbi:hypothetical protein MAA_11574 [Metarhizium robertsii ARSEF 23]|uniref:Uncharacterized protein n=1 Tax=Metarhizium robertsii (strain ARSEF 23 / ATCC MYA-3075) TaxID=655844 RepID=A0A0B2X7C0_METRA|nr:uncharacterized protein MAA_11574 [Metarhizium robertsii ARSEF 23]KHO10813.1 hypothetical protein MAA_11574 [Metarhizium robertsii ARSEF 23]